MSINDYSEKVYLDSLTESEKTALINYTSHESGTINHILRKQKNLLDLYENNIKLIDSALKKFEYKANLIVYRDLILCSSSLYELLKELEKPIVQEKGYYSCSMIGGSYSNSFNVRMNIVIPNTISPGAYIKYMSDRQKEEEYLIKRDTFYETIDIQNEDDKYYITRKILY